MKAGDNATLFKPHPRATAFDNLATGGDQQSFDCRPSHSGGRWFGEDGLQDFGLPVVHRCVSNTNRCVLLAKFASNIFTPPYGARP